MSTGNYMIDGDDGSHSFSPRYEPGETEPCESCEGEGFLSRCCREPIDGQDENCPHCDRLFDDINCVPCKACEGSGQVAV